MPKFCKKPVVIEAVQWARDANKVADTGYVFACRPLPDWLLAGLGPDGGVTVHDDGSVTIDTPEGVMRADPGDWIVKGVKGELYPCKPDIFAETYDPAD